MFFLREEALWELVTFEVTYPCALALPPGIISIGIHCCAPFWQTVFVGNWQSQTEHQTTNLQHSLEQKIIWTFNMQHLGGVSSLEGSIAVGGEDPINLAGFCSVESHSCKEFVPVCSIFPTLFLVRHIGSMGLSNCHKVEKDPLKIIIQSPNRNKHIGKVFPKLLRRRWPCGHLGR